ncbi:MAG: Gfo/Idh/MocA family oxidoreductase [Candidatus Omnitrophota bacterium]
MKNNNCLSIILVGCGAVSRFHYAPAIKAIAKNENIEVKALIDPAAENLFSLAKLFPQAKPVNSLNEAEINDLCLAVVASPPALHKEQVIYCLKKGAAVLCEKPMAANVTEAQAMVECAGKEKKLLAIGLFRRFFSSSRALKEIISNNSLGKLISFSIHEGEKFSWNAASDSLFKKSMTPGGVLYDLGVHVLDLLFWWLGEPIELNYQDDAMGGLEANCLIELNYPSSIKGKVQLSRDWQTQNSYTFKFEKGIVSWDVNKANSLSITLSGMSDILDGSLQKFIKKEEGIYEYGIEDTAPQSLIAQLINVVRAMRGQEKLFIPGQEGLASLRLKERCYENRRLMHMPWLTEKELTQAINLYKAREESK